MTTIINSQKTVTEQIEVELPTCREYGFAFYNIKSETSYIEVEIPNHILPDKEFSISINRNGYANIVSNILLKGTEISKERFVEVMTKALDHINHAAMMETADESMTFNAAPSELFNVAENISRQNALNSFLI